MNRQKAFTMIEIIVVLAIIIIIAAIVFAAISNQIAKARDARRKADIAQLQKAFDLYFADYGVFPGPAGWHNSNDSTWTTLENTLKNAPGKYMAKLPVDPINASGIPYQGNYAYGYYVPNVGQYGYGVDGCYWYMLIYTLEADKSDQTGYLWDCQTPDPSGWNYADTYHNTGVKTVGKKVQ